MDDQTRINRRKKLTEFGTRYAAAWSSRDPARLAAFYAENGSLIVNDGGPSGGRAAITETARRFMTAFPDMVVKMQLTRGGANFAVRRAHSPTYGRHSDSGSRFKVVENADLRHGDCLP